MTPVSCHMEGYEEKVEIGVVEVGMLQNDVPNMHHKMDKSRKKSSK